MPEVEPEAQRPYWVVCVTCRLARDTSTPSAPCTRCGHEIWEIPTQIVDGQMVIPYVEDSDDGDD